MNNKNSDSSKSKKPASRANGEELFDNESVASARECTGLVAAAPANEDEVKSYCQIYNIPLSTDTNAANHRRQRVKPSDKDKSSN